MPRLTFSVTLPDSLYNELKDAAKVCDMHPASFAAQALEVVLVTRREYVTVAQAERAMSHVPFEAEMREAG
jgi:predicted transcriptional regulator